MLDRARPSELRIVARLDHNPRYAGSSHDDAVAKELGYRAALIPGAFVYGFMSRFAIETWGSTWAERGTIAARFRRPVYDGDALVVEAAPIREDADGLASDMRVRNTAGEEVATGSVGLPHRECAMPDLEHYPIVPRGEPPAIAPGALRAGHRLRTRNAVLTADDLTQSLDGFGESHRLYRRDGIVHSGCLLRIAMGDTNTSCRFPTPAIFVATRTQHLGLARAGDRLATSGVVTAVTERKGQHYFDSEELLIANGTTPVALFRRTSIYAARRAAA